MVKTNKCYIFGGYTDEFEPKITEKIKETDFVICADKGLVSALKFNIKPNLVIGDFDSFSGEVPKNFEKIVLPIAKDDTDLHFSAKTAVKKGYRDFILSGVTGGRLDMTFATVSTMLYLFNNGCKISVLDKSSHLYITNSRLTLIKPEKNCTVSVFPIERVEEFSITGGKYPANNLTLDLDFPIGVSNGFDDEKIEISLKKGILLVIVNFK